MCFPLQCWHENCEKPISVEDLRGRTSEHEYHALMKASLNCYIRSNPVEYRYCRQPDCEAVYPRGGSYPIFTCPSCLNQTCTACHAEPHIGFTCVEFRSHQMALRDSQDERSLREHENSIDAQNCPNCEMSIENIESSQHMVCAICNTRFCWVYLDTFADYNALCRHMVCGHNDQNSGGETIDQHGDDDDEHENEVNAEEDSTPTDSEWRGSDHLPIEEIMMQATWQHPTWHTRRSKRLKSKRLPYPDEEQC
ncbi:hypothetical protein CC86DRAFT_460514 [Ophiobolus disseminans]|uniref:RBR-type E3 ubiquitin transferase n=1 Tax=Ophiobolus disseminans TaxID=1469910 RepID=A0A6A6ZFA9_9PLEO|nr:hypothetical protein CC86DRAFT_460514 [Ophiobolus disseminans]